MTAIQAINGDLTQRVAMHASTMEWQTSPSGTVWRQRLHLVGSAAAGQGTSMVRYEPNSTFQPMTVPRARKFWSSKG